MFLKRGATWKSFPTTHYVLISLTIGLLYAGIANAQDTPTLDRDDEADAYWRNVDHSVPTTVLVFTAHIPELQEKCLEKYTTMISKLRRLFYRVIKETAIPTSLVSIDCSDTVRVGQVRQVVRMGLAASAFFDYAESQNRPLIALMQRLFDDPLVRRQIVYRVISVLTPREFDWISAVDQNEDAKSFWRNTALTVPTTSVTIALSKAYFTHDCKTYRALMTRRLQKLIFLAIVDRELKMHLANVQCLRTVSQQGSTWQLIRIQLAADKFHQVTRSLTATKEQFVKDSLKAYLEGRSFVINVLSVHTAPKRGWYSFTFVLPWSVQCNKVVFPTSSNLWNSGVNFQSNFETHINMLRQNLTHFTKGPDNIEDINVVSVNPGASVTNLVMAVNARFPQSGLMALNVLFPQIVHCLHMACPSNANMPISLSVILGEWEPTVTS